MPKASNSDIARILSEIGEYLAMKNVPWKPRAYDKASQTIASLEEEVISVYEKGGLKAVEEIPGVGRSIAEKIEEFIKTGKIKYYEELKKKTPVKLDELTRIEGLGPKSVKKLYEKLGVSNLKELEKAAREGKIKNLEGFGPKSEENILKGMAFVKKSGGRFLLGDMMPAIKSLEAVLGRSPGVERLTVAGSVRRWKETIGDLDLLVVAGNFKPVMDAFTSLPGVVRVLAKGDTKSAVKLASGLQVDLRVVPAKSYGAALNYFTGSKSHNVRLRQIAINKGLKLNEYGLFSAKGRSALGGKGSKEKMIAGETEEEIYRALGMDYIEPEMREDTGEIELALRQAQGKQPGLPKLVGYGDLMGDLQTQTDWTDGSATILDMAKAASKVGLKYIAITDHTKRLAMTHGLDEARLLKQMAEIDRVNKELMGKIKVLKGTECDILKDGSLDIKDEVLAKLDVVGVSVHSYFNLDRKAQTERIIKAMENPNADILFHPTGRLIQKREAYDVDMDAVIAAAKKTKTILEIDAYPDRLDLKDEYIKKSVEAGVKMAIDSDAHAAQHFSVLEYGIAQARRGWAEREDIINAWPMEKMFEMLK